MTSSPHDLSLDDGTPETVSPELDRRFREAAVTAGLLDVGFDVVDSPVGPLLVAATDRGLCRISFRPDPEEQLDRLAGAFGPRVLRSAAAVESARRQLDEYFDGRRRWFDLDTDLRTTAPFARRVLDELARVPYGETTTYGALAQRVGAPQAARAVGTVMNRNAIPIVLPCHRVVGANGSLTGYGGGLHVKEHLLRLEGVLL
jgi:methylated-DNA-[protein]-cysteine S-methyltransferase